MEQIVDEKEDRSAGKQLDAIAAMFGLYIVAEGSAADRIPEVYLWPENVWVWNLFGKCRRQWVTDNGVRTNLNYQGVEVVMRMNRVKRRDEPDVFAKIQAMEEAMLKAWSE